MPRDGSEMPRGQPGNWRRWLPAAPPPAPGGQDAGVSGFAISTTVQPGRAGLLRRPVSR